MLSIYTLQRQASHALGWQKLPRSILHSDIVGTCGLEVWPPLSGETFDHTHEWATQRVSQQSNRTFEN